MTWDKGPPHFSGVGLSMGLQSGLLPNWVLT